jgi:predicted extracellular nuclease
VLVRSARPRARRPLSLLAATALIASGVGLATTPAARANPAGTGLVISEVYGGGGNSGATFTHDFIELYNPTGSAISVDGWSVQYRSYASTSAASGVTSLGGSVPAGGHFLIQEAAGAGGTTALPRPDVVGGISMSGAESQVWLATTTSPLNPSVGNVSDPQIADFVGTGRATSFETAAGPGISNTTAASRDTAGTDTDDNSADLTAGAPDPQNSGSGGGTTPTVSIAEIQGTSADPSPYAGQTVITRGVVTAAYPSGGFNGFFMQTEGTGGATDATPDASDGIFVYGSAGMAADPQIGDFVEVTAPVSEFNGLTELFPDTGGVLKLSEPPQPVTALVAAYPTTEAGREAHESELLAPTDTFTVTNNYTTNQYAEVWLATGTTPLVQPTDVARVGTAEYDAVVADNEARKVVLDDGASINFLSGTANKAIPLPWLSPTNTVRVGAPATLTAPVILDFRNSAWKFQPTHQVTDEGTDVARFSDTRTPAPDPVGGDLHLATFNVLNYFNTTGEDFVAAGGTCTYYTDRAGDPVTDRSCTPDGPRGAAQAEDLTRQQDKIVAAINGLGADVVSLEEIENSVKLGPITGETDRDDALSALVDALNAAAGSTRWAFAPSPDPAGLPDLADQDVIRTAFIYDPSTVALVGGSQVLVGDPDFVNAREPLAQVFKAAGADDADGFAVVVNHFKSKGDSDPPATGDNANGDQGAFNGDRTRQAESLVDFADGFAADRGVRKVLLTGDFNAYTEEDPMQVLYAAGFTKVVSDDPDDTSYSFSGLSGSLDHVLANDAALATVTGADIWEINANESVAFEYSRHNYNVTDFYASDVYRASDHNPEIVGLSTAVESTVRAWAAPTVVKVGKRTTVLARVSADGVRPTGRVGAYVDGELVAGGRLHGGRAILEVGPFTTAGTTTITVRYLGDEATLPSETTVIVRVVKRKGRH